MTINIFKDGELVKSFENQESDVKAFGWMLNNQGQSIDYALRHGGYKVQVIDKDGQESFWKPYSKH